MYLYLDHKIQNIEDKEFVHVSILYCDTNNHNYSVCRVYALKTDDIINQLSYLSQFDDITSMIGFKVRNDGKVVLTLK